MKPSHLFLLSFIAIITTYLTILGQSKTILVISAEYIFILALIPLVLTLVFFKVKLRGYEVVNFNANAFSLKTTVIFFLIFQEIDYIYEDGFIGMISLWFFYWIMGLIALLSLEAINYYKNYKLLKQEG